MFREQLIIEKFEKEFAKFVGTKYAVSCSSGFSALFLNLKALGVGIGDEVIVPDYTFIATATAVSMTGAKPVFVDVKENATIDIELVKKSITKKTKAIIAVNLYSREVDKKIEKLGVPVIYDKAEALGIKGEGCYSFHYSKTLPTEQGGMITTNNKKLADECRKLCGYYKDKNNCYLHKKIGYNFRLTSLQASVGLKKLYTLEKKIQFDKIKGDKLSRKYNEPLQNSYWVFVSSKLKKGKPAFVPLHRQPCYKQKGNFPTSDKLYKKLKYIYL